MNKLSVSTVFQYNLPDEKDLNKKIRVIWIDEDYIIAYFISLDGECPIPKKCSIKQLESEIDAGYLVEIDDPWLKSIAEASIQEMHKEIRDFAWAIAEYLWNNTADKDILRKEYRSQKVKNAATLFNTSEKKVMRVMSRFWQRGMTKNSLLPDYKNSGGKGKSKVMGVKKVGKPRYPSIYEDEVPEGINITEDIKRIIASSLDLYYWTKQKKSLREAYNLMLKKFFSDKLIIEGKEIYKVWDSARIPTYDQFYYWYKKQSDYKKNYISRLGERNFLLKQRELLGNSTLENFGPGSRYQIDATVADVYLLSSLSKDRLVIGRPIVYCVMDVYSRLVTGIYCGLEGPSWIGAMMALDNVVADKIEFCRQFGIEINNDDWPNSYLPETILADRGEFEGYNVENLINNLNIKIENTAPYKGDLKGIVERNFRVVNEKIKHTTPGAVQKAYRERCEKDYRLEAVLNLEQFTAIVICSVLHHNKSIIEDYPREKGMIAETIRPIPSEMWNWGLENRRCGFVKVNKDIVRLNLLPKGAAAITREGIRFKKLFFSSEVAMQEQWFINPQKRSTEIVYDPRNMNNIYIPDSKGRSFTKCFMLEKSRMYKNQTLEEIVFQQELENEIIRDASQVQKQNDVDYEANVQNIINQAKRESKKDAKQSNREIIKNIKENRAIEKESNRRNEHFEIDKKEKVEPVAQLVNIQKYNTDEDEYKQQSKLDLLRKKRDELRGR